MMSFPFVNTKYLFYMKLSVFIVIRSKYLAPAMPVIQIFSNLRRFRVSAVGIPASSHPITL